MSKIKKILIHFPYLWNHLFKYLKEKKYKYRKVERTEKMKIHIVAPDAENGWIVYKFGKSTFDELQKLGYEVTMSRYFDPSADINHYFMLDNIGYTKYSKVDKNTTFMIAHVDSLLKLDQIKELTDKGATGICMSYDTMSQLISCGVKRNKICYINPAQDGVLMPRKIVLGFTYAVYKDGRKRDDILVDICKNISPDAFRFIVMGSGWEDILSQVKNMGFEVEYYPVFDKAKYNELMPTFDYYCYFGFDEGSMGFLDAVACGIGTIVTPQGYHLDTKCGITYPVKNLDDIVDALHDLERKRNRHVDFVKTWTWENYAKKHVEIWNYILSCVPRSELLKNRGFYNDGIFSLLLNDVQDYEPLFARVKKVERLSASNEVLWKKDEKNTEVEE